MGQGCGVRGLLTESYDDPIALRGERRRIYGRL
jgi:hypothetical protein